MGVFDNIFNQTQTITPKSSIFGDLFSKPITPTITPQQQKIQQYQAEAQQQTTQANSFGGILKNAFTSLTNRTGITGTLGSIQQAGISTGQALAQKNYPQAIASGAQLGARVVGGAFTPITAATEIAKTIPGLKQAEQLLELPFVALGATGQFIADRFVDVLPVRKETKDVLRPAFQEVGSLTAQIWLGKKVLDVVKVQGDIPKNTIDIFKEEAKRVDVQNRTPETQRVMVNPKPLEVRNQTPRETQIDTQTPFIPNEKLPTIQLGGYARPKPEIPQIQLQPKVKTPDLGYTVEPIFERSTKPGIEGKYKLQTNELPQPIYDTFNEFRDVPKGRLILRPQDLIRTEIKPSIEVKNVTGAGENPVSFTRLSIKHLSEKGLEGEKLLQKVPDILKFPEEIRQSSQSDRYLISKSFRDASGRPHAVILEVTENNGNIIVTAFKTDSIYLSKFDLLWRAGASSEAVPPSQHSFIKSGGSTLSDLRGDQVSKDITKPILAKESQVVKGGTYDTTKPVKSPRSGILKPVEGTGQTKTRGLSQGVEISALQNDLTKGFGDLPEYKQVNMREQAIRANDLLMKDIESAKAIAMGEKAPPKGLLPESVFVALEKQAIRDGDGATLRELATGSKLSDTATTMGQRIKMLSARDVDSPTAHIREIQQARAEKLKIKDLDSAREEVVKQIKSEIKKTKTTKETVASFIESLKC